MFPDEPVPEIAGPEMATCLRAFWECCWVHGIDPRNPGHASDIAPEILEELEHFSSVEPDQPALLCPMVSMRRPTRPSMWRPSSQLSTSPGITLQVRQSRLWNAGGPAGLAALEARDAAERQAQLRHACREAAAERPARAWDTSEDVIHLRLAAPEQPARAWDNPEDVIHLHLGA